MDDFRVGSTPPYTPNRDEQRPADSNRKKTRRPISADHEDEVLLEQSAGSDSETENDLGVEDYYVPSDRSEDPGQGG